MNKNPARKWTADDDLTLLTLWKSNLTIEEIADQMERGTTVIGRHSRWLGLPPRGQKRSERTAAYQHRVVHTRQEGDT